MSKLGIKLLVFFFFFLRFLILFLFIITMVNSKGFWMGFGSLELRYSPLGIHVSMFCQLAKYGATTFHSIG